MPKLDGMSDNMIADANLSDIEQLMGERGISFDQAYEQARGMYENAETAVETLDY